MFISSVWIKNYRLFDAKSYFKIDDFNIPNGTESGSGLNVFTGENGCGKTSLLEAITLPILEFKADSFSLEDMNDPKEKVEIRILSDKDFNVAGTMPKSGFSAKGLELKAGCRSRENKSYLSSMVIVDQLFVKSNPDKPKDGSPDLRLSVNNPFSGKRFNENDVVFLDRNRLYQTRCGSFNSTRFDRLMEDFSYQYLKKTPAVPDLNSMLDEEVKKDKIENKFLELAIAKFNEISDIKVRLELINNYQPFKNAYFAQKKDNNQQISISNLGSGYEMIFSLIYSYFLSQQSGKQLIILIDEPELHLHPILQDKFIRFLIEISKEAQVFITTHSPLLIKQLAYNDRVKTMIVRPGLKVTALEDRKLPFISSNETNFLAFNLATEEYFNELYEELKYLHGEEKGYKDFDNDFFVTKKGEPKDSPWIGHSNEVSRHTFIRNQIHHQRDNGKPDYVALRTSIEKMRTYF